MNSRLSGIHIPVVTPFDEGGELRVDMLEANLERWGSTPVRGYMVLGSNGEFRSLSDDEALAVIEVAASRKGDKTLIAGIGRESLYLTLRFLERIARLDVDVDYVSVIAPGYFASLMSDQAVAAYYRAIADESPVPVLVYNAPGFTNGVSVSPAVMREMAAHPNVHGMKDSSAGMMVEYFAHVGDSDDFAILAGSVNTLMTCLAFGGSGGVVSPANYLPEQCAEVTELYFSGHRDAALDNLTALVRLARATAGKHGVAGIKCCMNLLGYEAGVPRLPVRALSLETQASLARELRAHGLLNV